MACSEPSMMRIAFYGDSFIDEWSIEGTRRINADGVEIVTDSHVYMTFPGGAANAARALQHFGAECIDLSPIPCQIKRRIMRDGVLVRREDARTNVWQGEPIRDLDCVDADAFVLSDYGKGSVDSETVNEVIAAARRCDAPCVIDAKRMFANVDYFGVVFKCNRHEWDNRSADDIGGGFPNQIVVTNNDNPPTIISRYNPGVPFAKPTWPRRPFQYDGAGDNFAAFLAYYLARKHSLRDAVEFAYRAAGAAGYFPPFRQPVLPREVDAIVDPSRLKILRTRDELEQWLRFRVRGFGTLAVTNGCFQIFGSHHAEMLRESATQADHLLVLVNSDASTAKLKGSCVAGVEDRMRVLAAHESVSAIAAFDEIEPTMTMAMINDIMGKKIGVICKGGDRVDEIIPGAEYAEKVYFTRRWPGNTSATMKRISSRSIAATSITT